MRRCRVIQATKEREHPAHDFDARRHAEAHLNVGEVSADRRALDAEQSLDLLVALSLQDQAHDLGLALRERKLAYQLLPFVRREERWTALLGALCDCRRCFLWRVSYHRM